MNEQKKTPLDMIEWKEVNKNSAMQLVEVCGRSGAEETQAALQRYTAALDRLAKQCVPKELSRMIQVVYQGLRYQSELAGALKYFYMGYYAKLQESVTERLHQQQEQLALCQLASRRYFDDILQYLYRNGISQQKDIVAGFQKDKSNLSRLLNEMTRQNLLHKFTGPKAVFYELSPQGYAYYRGRGSRATARAAAETIWMKKVGIQGYEQSFFEEAARPRRPVPGRSRTALRVAADYTKGMEVFALAEEGPVEKALSYARVKAELI